MLNRIVFLCCLAQLLLLSQLFGDCIYISGQVITDQDNTVRYAQVQFTETADSSVKFTMLTDSLGYYELIITGVKQHYDEPIKTFQLYQNYPNPFSEGTSICYQLPESELVKITIFDILGRKVKTMVSNNQRPGVYKTYWDGTDDLGNRVSGGIYFFQITTPNKRMTHKMIYLPGSFMNSSTKLLPSLNLMKNINMPDFYDVFINNTDSTYPRIVPFEQCNVEVSQDTVLNFQVEEVVGTWEFLGLEDKRVGRLVLAEPYLYVCAWSDGLWRKDIRESNTEWEYVGLADTSDNRYYERVEDVVIHWQNSDWLLVAYSSQLATDHSIYRSFNDGRTWEPADSGLGGTYIMTIKRFLQYPDRILAAGESVHTTRNFGDYWDRVPEPIGANLYAFERHPKQHQIIWLGGSGITFDPIPGVSADSGYTWKYIDLNYNQTIVYSIAFDYLDTNIVYVTLGGDIVKTTDMGKSWVSLPTACGYVLSDPRNSTHLWGARIFDLVETWNSGTTWQPIPSQLPDTTGIWNMIGDDKTEAIYIGTRNGVYLFKPEG